MPRTSAQGLRGEMKGSVKGHAMVREAKSSKPVASLDVSLAAAPWPHPCAGHREVPWHGTA